MSDKIIMETVRISDLSFEEYNQRQLAEISPDRNRERAHAAKPAGNFLFDGHQWVPQEYKGFAVISMLNENEENESLVARLTEIQTELQYNLSPRLGFYQLPADSFHQTIANTLSNDRFKKNITDAGLENAYPAMVAKAVWNIPGSDNIEPVRMRMAGLSIFGTAIGILGVFENKDDYNRILRFRSDFYNDEQMAQLDVKMTRPFIGHITLTYIEQNLTKNQKDHLADVVNELNETLADEENYFSIAYTGLRRFQHLAEFIKQDNYPVHSL
jgi:hypothetical protein